MRLTTASCSASVVSCPEISPLFGDRQARSHRIRSSAVIPIAGRRERPGTHFNGGENMRKAVLRATKWTRVCSAQRLLRLQGCFACVYAALVVCVLPAGCELLFPVVVSAAGTASSASGPPPTLLSSSLAVPAVEELTRSGQEAAGRVAMLSMPQAVAARAASRTRFESLDRAGAVALAEKTFGIQHPSWTAPDSNGEGHITTYLGENIASEVTPAGQHLMLASTVRLRSAVGSGRLAPTSLTLQQHGNAFEPVNPVVPVSIANVPASGVQLPFEVSVAPQQAAAPEEAMTVGNRVVYPGTATDTDFMVEPVPAGVELSWQLLGEDSPQENALRFSLPAGASLQLSKSSQGGAEVVKEGKTLEAIRPASAIEADGTALPVSYTVAGDVLVTHVNLEGSVAFPVVVDPVVEGTYGSYGAGTWTGWESGDNCGTGCYGFFASASQLNVVIANAPWPSGYEGWWKIFAPGAGAPEGAGIVRVDVDGVSHDSEQSMMSAEINGSDGSAPGWTFNGGEPIKPEDLGQYESPQLLGNAGMAFCAQEGGGSNEQLCNYEYTGPDFIFRNEVLGSTSVYNYTEITGAVVRFRDIAAPSYVHLYGPVAEGHWTNGAVNENYEYIEASDVGVGVASLDLEIPPGAENQLGQPYWAHQVSCPNAGFDGCPHTTFAGGFGWPSSLGTGIYKVGVYAIDAAENIREQEPAPELHLDRTPPKLTLSGPLNEQSGNVIGEGNYALDMSAEDGSTSAPQSGVQEIVVHVDGWTSEHVYSKCSDPVGVPKGECFGLNGTWTFGGQYWGVGKHTIEVTAIDWAGNRTTTTLQVTVRAAATQPLGPGAVNLRTGDYRLEATDANIAAADAQLSVSRVYDSRQPNQGGGGPLGPQWALSLPDLPADGIWNSLRGMPNGNVAVTLASGMVVTFEKNGSNFASPAGFQTFTLSELSASPLEYEIVDAGGNATTFKLASATKEEAPLLLPATSSEATAAGGLDKLTYVYATSEGTTQPTEVIAPYPSSINCVAELVRGCRALELRYATATTTEGEGESQWKEYKGRLAEIKLVAWNGKEMTKTPVAEYAFDAQGRLRAEWNPQIATPLKTIYGYDSEGHVTAVTGPGQETWAFTYGTIAGDVNRGRLLKVLQAPPATTLWGGEPVANSEKPVLSGSAEQGVRMAVSQGKWSGSPVAYSYRWEDCNASGGECTAILGADNPNYTPVSGDVGHTLIAQVQATNGSGSLTASTAASATVGTAKGTEAGLVAAAPGSTVEYGVPLTVSGRQSMTKEEVAKWGQGRDVPVEGTAIFPADEPQSWPASDYKRATIYYLDASANTVDVANPAGGIAAAEYDPHGDATRTLSADNLATALKGGTKSAEVAKPLYTEYQYNSPGTEVEETLGPEHEIKLPSGSEVEARKQVKYSYNEEGAPAGGPYRLATSTTEAALTGGKAEDARTVKNSYSGQEGLGWKLHEPTSTTVAAGSLNLVHSALYSSTTGAQIETAMPGAAAKEAGGLGYLRGFGTEGETLYAPSGEAIDAHGNLWVADAAWGRIDEFSSSGAFIKAFGSWGAGVNQFETPRGVAINPTTKNIYIGDEDSSRVVELNEKGEFIKAFGFGVSNGEAKLQTCTTSCKIGIAGAAAGQFSEPQGIAIDSTGNLWITDFTDNRVDEYTEKGEFIAAFGFGVSNGESKLQTCTTTCKAGLIGNSPGEFYYPSFIAISASTLYVTDYGNNRVEKFNTAKEYQSEFASTGKGNLQLLQPSGITVGPGGNLYVADYGNNRVQEFSSSGGYVAQFGTEGAGEDETKGPESVAISSGEDMYVTDKGNRRVDEWAPSLSGNSGAYTSQTIYYTPKTEATIAECQNHPEWANLPCQTQPAHQPEVAGMPALPSTTYTYNLYDEPEVTKTTAVEGSEAYTRTQTNSYNAAGRITSKETKSTTGTTLPKVTYTYSSTTGLPIKETTGTGSSEEKLTEEYNKAGQLTAYTDASGKTTTYEYEKEKDERPIKVADEKGNQALGYNETTGELTSLKDSSGTTFTATYDAEGNLASEAITPIGLTATTTRNASGEPVSLVYKKETHCTENCEWFYDDVAPSIHGQWITQTTNLAKDTYAYNEAGWLTQAQEEPTGGKCATRLYAYNADGDRTSLTKRAPATPCAKEGGEVQEHHYDTADRLLDAGITYNPFGDITTLSGSDAGGEPLKSTFYADGQLAGQEQAGQSNSYNLDPARRTNETISVGHTTATSTDQYDGPGATPAWLAYITGEWTRNISGISGALAATQADTETPIVQLADLHGDTIGTVLNSETATKPASTLETTEYGVPTVAVPPPHSWLGATGARTELSSGVLNLGARSYVPQIGRFLQPDPQPGGSANAYSYTQGDPLNESDPSGELSRYSESGGLSAVGSGEGVELQNGVGLGSDAILPPPPDTQAEQAVEAEALADQETAGADEPESEFPYWWTEEGEGGSGRPIAHAAMINRDGVTGSCGCEIWIHGGKMAIRSGHDHWLGAAEVMAGTAGAALSGFAFGACALGGGEVDVAIHCVLGPGVAFAASLSVVGAGLKELF
jgi:RHS repeat-associated protein